MKGVYRACGRLGWPVVFDFRWQRTSGVLDPVGMPWLEECLREFPETIFVGHGPAWWAEIGDLRHLRTLEAVRERAQERAAAGQGSADSRKLRADIQRAERFLRGLLQRIQLVPAEPVMAPPDAREYAILRATTIDHILALGE